MRVLKLNGQLCFTVGEIENGLIPVDMKIGRKEITSSDNFAYIPQMRQSIFYDIDNISKKGHFNKYRKYLEGLSSAETLEFIVSVR